MDWGLTGWEADLLKRWCRNINQQPGVSSQKTSKMVGPWHTGPVAEAQGVGLVQPGEGKTSGDLTAAPVPARRWSQAFHRGTWQEDERQPVQVETRGSDYI